MEERIPSSTDRPSPEAPKDETASVALSALPMISSKEASSDSASPTISTIIGSAIACLPPPYLRLVLSSPSSMCVPRLDRLQGLGELHLLYLLLCQTLDFRLIASRAFFCQHRVDFL